MVIGQTLPLPCLRNTISPNRSGSQQGRPFYHPRVKNGNKVGWLWLETHFQRHQQSVLLSDELKSFVQFYCTILFLLLWHDCVVLSAQPDCVSGYCCPCLSRDVFRESLWTSRPMLSVHFPSFQASCLQVMFVDKQSYAACPHSLFSKQAVFR